MTWGVSTAVAKRARRWRYANQLWVEYARVGVPVLFTRRLEDADWPMDSAPDLLRRLGNARVEEIPLELGLNRWGGRRERSPTSSAGSPRRPGWRWGRARNREWGAWFGSRGRFRGRGAMCAL